MSGKDPYPRPYLSSSTSAPKSGESPRFPISRRVPLESEEELVYFTDENSLPLIDNGITKTTEFKITERGPHEQEVERVHVRLKQWERQGM